RITQVSTVKARRFKHRVQQPHGLIFHIRSKICVGKLGIDEARAAEICYYSRPREICPVEPGAQHLCGKYTSTLQGGVTEVRVKQPGLVEHRAIELCADEFGLVEAPRATNPTRQIQPRAIQPR